MRQGVRAGVESYSIKRLEPLCGYGRRVDLAEATASLIALEAALEEGTAAGDGERRRVVAGYNEDDCRATLALRDWLEGRRAELAERLGQELPRPVFAEKPGAAEDPETARIRSALLAGVSAETPGAIAWDVSAETSAGQARVLLADLIDWHRREDKPAWWRYFYLRTLSPAELIGEPDALGGLSGGEVVGQVKRSVVRRFRFPAQEHKFSTGGTAYDPATGFTASARTRFTSASPLTYPMRSSSSASSGSSQCGLAAIAGIQDLEAQGLQYASCAVYASAEVVGAKRTACCELVGDAEDGLGVVALPVEYQQVGAGAAESVSCEKLVLSEVVVFGGRLPDVMWLNWIPEGHPQIVGHGIAGCLWVGSSRTRYWRFEAGLSVLASRLRSH